MLSSIALPSVVDRRSVSECDFVSEENHLCAGAAGVCRPEFGRCRSALSNNLIQCADWPVRSQGGCAYSIDVGER